MLVCLRDLYPSRSHADRLGTGCSCAHSLQDQQVLLRGALSPFGPTITKPCYSIIYADIDDSFMRCCDLARGC